MADFTKKPGFSSDSNKKFGSNNSKREEAPKDLPAAYVKDLMDGYFTDKGVMKLSMVVKYPKELAALFSKCKTRDGKAAVTNKQVRSFYEAIVKADTQLSTGQKSIEEVLIDINMHTGYVNNKVKKEILPEVFGKFITLNIEGITTAQDVKAFKRHFEALVCYLPIEK